MNDEPKPEETKPVPAPEMKKDGAAKPKSANVVKTLTHGKPLLSVRFDPTGKYLFASGQDYRITRHSFEDDSKITLPDEHDSWVRGLRCTPDGATLLTVGYDGQMIWWPAADDEPKPIRKLVAHHGWVREVAISPDGKLAATCGNDNLVKLWETATGNAMCEFPGHERHVYNVAFHPDGVSLVSNDLMGNFKHWNIATGKLLREFRQEKMHKYDTTFRADIGGARGMAFNEVGTYLAASGITEVSNAFAGVGKPTVELIDWETAKPIRRYVQAGKGTSWGVALHPENFVIASYMDSLLFWSYTDAKLFHQVKVGNDIFDLSLHRDGQHVATAHNDGKIRITKLASKDA